MRNALLIAHVMDAITTATVFLSQMATLVDSINIYFLEDGVPERQKTYMRSTSKKEAAASARYAGS